MNKLKRFKLTLAALLLFSGVAMVLPVSARGQGNPSSDVVTQGTTTTDNSGSNLAQQFREQAQEKLQEALKNAGVHTKAEREKACTARKANLTKRMNNAVSQAKKHKVVFNKIYANVKDFYNNKKLNVPDYATLTAAVDTAGTNAQNSIDALQSLDVSVDCTSQTVASSVSAFQQAVASTRDSLKAYRAAIVDLINSLKGASTGTDNSSTNSPAQ